jgi:hypothetical protein
MTRSAGGFVDGMETDGLEDISPTYLLHVPDGYRFSQVQ